MSIKKRSGLFASAVVLFSVFALAACGESSPTTEPDNAKTSDAANTLKLSALAEQGKVYYDRSCAQCHGLDVMGTDMGPPLIHEIYNPGHHGDNAFFRAITQGTVQHHWQFGNMPPRPEVKDSEIGGIIQYVRELQVAHGIVYKQHRM